MRLREQKDGRPLPHQDRRPRLTVRYPQQIQATESKTLQAKGAKFRAATKNWQNPSCKLWHPPVFLNYKSETGCKGGSMLDHQLLPFLLHAVGIERVRGDLRHHWLLTLPHGLIELLCGFRRNGHRSLELHQVLRRVVCRVTKHIHGSLPGVQRLQIVLVSLVNCSSASLPRD